MKRRCARGGPLGSPALQRREVSAVSRWNLNRPEFCGDSGGWITSHRWRRADDRRGPGTPPAASRRGRRGGGVGSTIRPTRRRAVLPGQRSTLRWELTSQPPLHQPTAGDTPQLPERALSGGCRRRRAAPGNEPGAARSDPRAQRPSDDRGCLLAPSPSRTRMIPQCVCSPVPGTPRSGLRLAPARRAERG